MIHASKNSWTKFFFFHRLTDLCEYCEQGRIIKVKIERCVKELGYNIGEYLNLDAFKDYNFKAAIE